MGTALIKLNDGKRDYYLEWSTIVDAPITEGMSLDDLTEHVRQQDGSRGVEALAPRLKRCDETGTSFHDQTVAGVLAFNRAGPGERHASVEEILAWYCHGKPKGESR